MLNVKWIFWWLISIIKWKPCKETLKDWLKRNIFAWFNERTATMQKWLRSDRTKEARYALTFTHCFTILVNDIGITFVCWCSLTEHISVWMNVEVIDISCKEIQIKERKEQPNAELYKPPYYLTMVRLIDCYLEIEPKYWVKGLITKAIVVWFFNWYDLEQFDLCRYCWRLTRIADFLLTLWSGHGSIILVAHAEAPHHGKKITDSHFWIF